MYDKSRISVGFSPADLDKLNRVMETSRCSARLVFSALMSFPQEEILKAILATKAKEALKRKMKKDLFQDARRKIKLMTPEQLAKIDEILNGN